MLFGSYRRGDANDPDAYVAAIAAVLSMFETEIIRKVTDPRTGIATTEKFMTFMPNAGELKVYCDGVAARRARIQKYTELPAPNLAQARLPRQPVHRANCFIGAEHHRFAEAEKWSQTADNEFWRAGAGTDGPAGIWVDYEEFNSRVRPKARQEPAAPPAEPQQHVDGWIQPSNQAEEINTDDWRNEAI